MNSRRTILATIALSAIVGSALCATASGASAADSPSPAPTASAAAAEPVRVVAADEGALHAAASAVVARVSLKQKAASVVMGHVPTTDVGQLRAYMRSSGAGGFILMGANIPATESALRELTAGLTLDPALPPLIAVDEEGGDVTRLPWDSFPSSLSLKSQPAGDSRTAFAGRAALVQRAGIGVDFGIVADTTPDPDGFIFRRSLGATPAAASARVTAAVVGQSGIVLSTLKHFPGHGAAAGDSHTMIPTTSLSKGAWAGTDAQPFAAGIKAGAPLLMFGHLAYTAVDKAPASLSATWHRIARTELGFTGVAITDDLGMLQASGIPAYADPVANAVAALAAGNDMVLAVMFTTPASASEIATGIAAAVTSGRLSQARLDEAATRVVELRLATAAAGRGLMPCPSCAAVG